MCGCLWGGVGIGLDMGRVSASGYEGLAGVVLCGLLWLVVPRGLSWQGVWFLV